MKVQGTEIKMNKGRQSDDNTPKAPFCNLWPHSPNSPVDSEMKKKTKSIKFLFAQKIPSEDNGIQEIEIFSSDSQNDQNKFKMNIQENLEKGEYDFVSQVLKEEKN